MQMNQKFARNVFRVAAVYGFIVMVPQYFLEERINTDSPPAITHPEFYYGFIGVTLVFQIVFFVIASDPVRFRPLMVVSVLEKLSFAAAVVVLFVLNRVEPQILIFGGIDCILAVLFIVALSKTPRSEPTA